MLKNLARVDMLKLLGAVTYFCVFAAFISISFVFSVTLLFLTGRGLLEMLGWL
jgi:hypothetical protein